MGSFLMEEFFLQHQFDVKQECDRVMKMGSKMNCCSESVLTLKCNGSTGLWIHINVKQSFSTLALLTHWAR